MVCGGLEDEDAEPRALTIGHRVAREPDLAGRAVDSLRSQLGPPTVSRPAAASVERAGQMWSTRRRHGPVGG
jgi:enoyl-CoA hydratase